MNLKSTGSVLFFSGAGLIGLPLVGCHLAGLPVRRYLEFPPQTRYVAHAPFSAGAFFLYSAFILLVVGVVMAAGIRGPALPAGPPSPTPLKNRFPVWGWGALLGCAAFWTLAWTRFAWFTSWQPHTFFPLWFSFIILINAICYYRSGGCMLINHPLYFIRLFFISALFWWFFEYLNRFVQNWHYTGSTYPPLTYCLLATLSFSTVLPAVLGMRDLLRTCKFIENRFYGLKPWLPGQPKTLAWFSLLLAGGGLAGIGVWPDLLFPLLWVAPLLVITSLQHLHGQTHVLSKVSTGDWRPVVSAAVAALICGGFWEMWNLYSLARWTYSVPLVHRFQIFEMPLLGYAGYLPFGLECAAVSQLLRKC